MHLWDATTEGQPYWVVAGDTIIDWVIKDGKATPAAGGCGNVVRGLLLRGHNIRFLTCYNPALYPLHLSVPLLPESVTDLGLTNVFVRNYSGETFHRFRHGIRSGIFDVRGALAVVCHEESVVRRFDALFADVRDVSVRGRCDILRMSSSDPWQDIMENIDWKIAVITHKDHLHVFSAQENRDFFLEFPAVRAVDDIGAGDAFDTGFLDWFLNNKPVPHDSIYDGFRYAIKVAQEKVQRIGVFMENQV